MPKLPNLKGGEVVAALKKDGWFEQRQRGSHLHMRNDKKKGYVVVPMHSKTIPPGTLRSIIRQANLTVDEFLELL